MSVPLLRIQPGLKKFYGTNFWGRGSRSHELEASAVSMMLELSKLSLKALLSGAASDLFGFFELSLTNGYFRFRLGFPFGQTQGALRSSRSIGFLVIVRGGPLDGLRYTADHIS
jgi:hypothetical protein